MNNEPFFLNGKRAMISLGPLSKNRHCPYNCAFCYVQDGFKKYHNLTDEEIMTFLYKNREKYKIIYISGDTDSFAPPRTKRSLELMKKISKEIDVDLLFTTRTIFSNTDLIVLKEIAEIQKNKNKQFYACISISRYSECNQYLEPLPIPSPDERINTLKDLKNIGATTVLALRPFLPVVKVDEYLMILNRSKDFIDIVLGEPFYFCSDGVILKRLFPHGCPELFLEESSCNRKMSFNENNINWCVWNSHEREQQIKEFCQKENIIFAMKSDEAIEKFMRKNGNRM